MTDLRLQVQTVLSGHSLQESYDALMGALAVCLIQSAKDMRSAMELAELCGEDVRESVESNFEFVKSQAATYIQGNGPGGVRQ